MSERKKVNFELDLEELGGVPRFEHATTQQVIEQLINIPNFAKLYSK